MRSRLQMHLPGFVEGRMRIDTLRVMKARRNTSLRRNPCPMTMCYELQGRDLATGLGGTQTLYAKVYRAGLAEDVYRKQDRNRLVRPAFGPALAYLPELDMVLWALPNDPGLPQLARLMDPAQARRLLPSATLSTARLDRPEVELLRYEPECRATLRYTLKDASGTEVCTLYAKTFSDDRARDVHRRFAYFWQLAQTDPDAPLVARPLGYSEAVHTAWQAAARGMPLLHALHADHATCLIARLAYALARLHAAPVTLSRGGTPRSAEHWVTESRRRQKKISRADPALAARVARVVEVIERQAGRQTTRPLGLIHGDFHPGQVWVNEGRVVLFDFDEFTLGDPMEDLASFVVKLEQAGTRPELTSALIEQYAACAPHRFDRRSLDWHLTVQALLQASRAFVFQRDNWAAELECRLAHSEACAAALNGGNL
jgi:hypothetical protein